jgi:hypothetical protein
VKEEALAHWGLLRQKQTNKQTTLTSTRRVMKVLTAPFCNDTVVSWTDARFEILIALAVRLTILISVDVLMLSIYLIKF